jgi:LysM domain
MRKALLTAALVAVAVGSPAANAQYEASKKSAKKVGETTAAAGDQAEEGSDEGGEDSDGSPMEGEVELKSTGSGEGGAGTMHTVEKGDTLWDLSQRYLGSPWYWPKVWSYNPEIANPHWIYPGNRVKFTATGEETPTQVEVGTETQTQDVEPGEMLPEDKVQVMGRIGYVPKNAFTVRLPGFVTEKDVEESGKITGSFGQMEMLSYPETAYVRFTKKASAAKTGDNYIVYKMGSEVRHPDTGARVGVMTVILGVVRVVKVHDRKKDDDGGQFVTVRVMNSYDDIRRGDLIGPYAEPLVRSVSLRANDKSMDAVLVGKAVQFLTMSGEHMLVVVDKGSNDGVQPGNTFNIYRQQDGLHISTMVNPSARNPDLPKEDVGACMAFDVKTTATLCLVTNSIRELVVGDRLEMRSGTASSPRAER